METHVKHKTLLKVFGQYGDVEETSAAGRGKSVIHRPSYEVLIHQSNVRWEPDPATSEVRRILVNRWKCDSLRQALRVLSMGTSLHRVGVPGVYASVQFTIGMKAIEKASVNLGICPDHVFECLTNFSVTARGHLIGLSGLCSGGEDGILRDWIMDHHDAARDLIEARSEPAKS